MPIERVSKSFKDVSMTFKVNPLNMDLNILKNENAIARSVRNLVLTRKGERFFDSDIGCGVSDLLFELMDDLTSIRIKNEIKDVINQYEPRVNLINVNVSANYDSHSYDIIVRYKIVGINADPQELSFALQSTR
jgi:phage baseplate assembly protein W